MGKEVPKPSYEVFTKQGYNYLGSCLVLQRLISVIYCNELAAFPLKGQDQQ